jgi:hypothetical protein
VNAHDRKVIAARVLVDGRHVQAGGDDLITHERRRVAMELLRLADWGAVEVNHLATRVISNPHDKDLSRGIESDIVYRGGRVIVGRAEVAA